MTRRWLSQAPLLGACSLLVFSGCPRPEADKVSAPPSPEPRVCVIEKLPEAEEVLAMLEREAWAFKYRGGPVNMKVQIYYQIIDKGEPIGSFTRIAKPENLVFEQVGWPPGWPPPVSWLQTCEEGEQRDFSTAEFTGKLVFTMPDSIRDDPDDVVEAVWTVRAGFPPGDEETRAEEATSMMSERLGEILPEAFFAQKHGRGGSTGRGHGAGSWQLKPGETAELVSISFYHGAPEEKRHAVALVLTAWHATEDQFRQGTVWPHDATESKSTGSKID